LSLLLRTLLEVSLIDYLSTPVALILFVYFFKPNIALIMILNLNFNLINKIKVKKFR